MLQKLIDRYCQALTVLMAAALALMVVLVFTNVGDATVNETMAELAKLRK